MMLHRLAHWANTLWEGMLTAMVPLLWYNRRHQNTPCRVPLAFEQLADRGQRLREGLVTKNNGNSPETHADAGRIVVVGKARNLHLIASVV